MSPRGAINDFIVIIDIALSIWTNERTNRTIYLRALSVAFLAWSFGAASQPGRVPMNLLALLIGTVLLLIMDVNRPQRGIIEVGVISLERVSKSISAP